MPKQGLAKVLNGDIQRRKSHVIVPPIEIKVPPFSQYLPKVMVFHNLFQQSAILESISRNVHRFTMGAICDERHFLNFSQNVPVILSVLFEK